MDPTEKELLEQRAELATKIKAMADEFNANGGAWKDAEQEKNWEALNKDYDEVLAALERKEAAKQVALRARAVADANAEREVFRGEELAGGARQIRQFSVASLEEARCIALAGWMRNQMGEEPTDVEVNAAEAIGLPLNRRRLEFQLLNDMGSRDLQSQFWSTRPDQRRSILNAPLTSTTAATGGNIIPPEQMLRMLEVNMLAFGSVLQVAETINTASGEDMSWPTVDDTGNKGRLVAESTAIDDNAGAGSSGDGGPNPTFGKTTWYAYKYTSDTILVPYELLQDTPFNLPALLGAMIGERLGRILEEHMTTGTGSSQPSGIVTGASLGVTAASSSVIAPDEVYDLQHSVDPAYRNGAAFMCHDDVILHLRKKKDTQNNYLWQSGFNTGVPDTLAGSRFFVNQEMSSTFTTGQKLMLFGQLSKYKVRRVGTLRFYRLQERYRHKDQDGFVGLLRADGGLLDAGTAPVKYLALA